jgi:hypothetical protein
MILDDCEIWNSVCRSKTERTLEVGPMDRYPYYTGTQNIQSRKLKSRYRARNRLQEPSLELSSQAAGTNADLVPSSHSGT